MFKANVVPKTYMIFYKFDFNGKETTGHAIFAGESEEAAKLRFLSNLRDPEKVVITSVQEMK